MSIRAGLRCLRQAAKFLEQYRQMGEEALRRRYFESTEYARNACILGNMARLDVSLVASDRGVVTFHAARPAVGPPGLLRVNPGSRLHLYRARLV
jgi:hypothetical protein